MVDIFLRNFEANPPDIKLLAPDGRTGFPVADWQIPQLIPDNAWNRTWIQNPATLRAAAVVVTNTGLPVTDWQIPQPLPDNAWNRAWAQNPLTLRVSVTQPSGVQFYERPPRDPREARSWTWSYNLNLIGQDRVPGEASIELPPRDYPERYRSWTSSYNLNLIGKDQLPIGESITDRPPTITWYQTWTQSLLQSALTGTPVGEALTERPPTFAWYQTWTLNLLQGTLTPAAQAPFSQDDWPLPRAPQQPAQSWTWSYNLNLIGRDRLPAGAEVLELPPREPAPNADRRTWTWQYNLNLVAQDRMVVGQEFTELPPKAPARASNLDTWIWSYNLNLVNQDRLPTGKIVTDLAPRDHLERYRSWAWQYNLNLIGQDQITVGEQLTDRPPPITWYRDWSQNLLQSTLAPVFTKPFLQSDWPLTPAPRQAALGWTWSYNLNLIGQDRLPTGQQSYDLAPRAADRANELRTWINQVNQALNQAPQPFSQSDWPNPRGPQQPDRSYGFVFARTLVGQDQLPVGSRSTDLPTKPYAEPATRTWTWSYNQNLTGQDRLPTGARVYDLAPVGYVHPVQLRTWLWSYNLRLIGQDVLPTGRIVTDLAPRGPIGASDLRTWINLTSLALQAGAVALPFNQYAWPNPLIAGQPDRGFSATYNANLIGKDRLPPGARSTDLTPSGPAYPVTLRTIAVNLQVPQPTPPPPPSALISRRFIADVGTLMSR